MRQLIEHHLTPAESARNIWLITVESDVTLEDVLKPEYWAHTWRKLRPMDRIEVTREDSDFWAELLVINVGRGYAVVNVLQEMKMRDEELAELEGEEVTPIWKGPTKKWCLRRNSDGMILQDGMPTKEAAMEAAANYLKTVA